MKKRTPLKVIVDKPTKNISKKENEKIKEFNANKINAVDYTVFRITDDIISKGIINPNLTSFKKLNEDLTCFIESLISKANASIKDTVDHEIILNKIITENDIHINNSDCSSILFEIYDNLHIEGIK